MKRLVLIFYFCLNSSFVWAESCFDTAKFLIRTNLKDDRFRDLSSLELRNRISRVEGWNNVLRGSKDPAINEQIYREIDRVDDYLIAGEFARANRRWEGLFRNVEFAFYFVQKGQKLLKKAYDLNPVSADQDGFRNLNFQEFKEKFAETGLSSQYLEARYEDYLRASGSWQVFVRQLETEVRGELVSLGNNYQRYSLVRLRLTRMLDDSECDRKCQIKVRNLLDSFGANGENERMTFPDIFGNSRSPEFDSIRQMVYENRLSNLARLKTEYWAEVKRRFKQTVLQPEFWNWTLTRVINTPGINVTRLVRLFKVLYDYQARILYFPKINRIVRRQWETDELFHYFKEVSTTENESEFLTAFARRVDLKTVEKWKTLKEYAENHDPDYFENMKKAEILANQRGGISPTHQKDLITYLSAVIFGGGAFVGYSYLNSNGEVVEIETEAAEVEVEPVDRERRRNPPSERRETQDEREFSELELGEGEIEMFDSEVEGTEEDVFIFLRINWNAILDFEATEISVRAPSSSDRFEETISNRNKMVKNIKSQNSSWHKVIKFFVP